MTSAVCDIRSMCHPYYVASVMCVSCGAEIYRNPYLKIHQEFCHEADIPVSVVYRSICIEHYTIQCAVHYELTVGSAKCKGCNGLVSTLLDMCAYV